MVRPSASKFFEVADAVMMWLPTDRDESTKSALSVRIVPSMPDSQSI